MDVAVHVGQPGGLLVTGLSTVHWEYNWVCCSRRGFLAQKQDNDQVLHEPT